MFSRFAIGPPFLFPYSLGAFGDSIMSQHRIGFAPGNPNSGGIAVAAGVLREGIVNRFGSRRRVGCWMAASGDSAASMFGREEEKRPTAVRILEAHR